MVYLQEINRAVRALRRTRGFTLIAVGILTLGLTVNNVVFSIINAAMLRPLPYPNPEQLTTVSWYATGKLISRDVSAATFFALRNGMQSFESVAATANLDSGINLTIGDRPQYVKAFQVSIDYFRTLDVLPQLGRGFSSEEEQPGGPHAVVLSHALWQREFAMNRLVLGRVVRIDGEPFTIVGVMPASFHSYPEADLWLPLPLSPANSDPGNEYRLIVRLKKGVTQLDAQHELDLSEGRSITYPLRSRPGEVRLVMEGLQTSMVTGVRSGLTLMFGAVFFVLLITCANLALLLTVRTSGRIREIAIRLALRVSRASVIRIFLIESLIIAILGGISGTILAREAIPLVILLAPASLGFTDSITVDGRVMIFSACASLLTALMFGLVPAIRMSRTSLNELIRQTGGHATSGSQHARLGRILVFIQAALTIVLLSGSGLLLNSFAGLNSVPPGFEARNLWAGQISLASNRYQSTLASSQFVKQLCEKLRNAPGVETASSVVGLPLEHGLNLVLQSPSVPQKTVYAQYRMVSPDYFRTMQIPVVNGIPFSATDAAHTTPVAIVNQTLANELWPKGSAVGQYITVSSTMDGLLADPPRQIVGLVADVHESGLPKAPPPTIFVPVDQISDRMTGFANRSFLISIVIRTSDGSSPEAYLRAAVNSLNPELPVASVRSLTDVLSASLARQRFYTSLVTGFGILALVLTAIGLYGLLSWQIVLRTREIGVRMAVGAPRSEVVLMIVKQGVGLVVLGSLLGMLVAPLETKALATIVYNVRGATSVVIVSAALVLVAVAALASLLSAVRAASIEPTVTLTTE